VREEVRKRTGVFACRGKCPAPPDKQPKTPVLGGAHIQPEAKRRKLENNGWSEFHMKILAVTAEESPKGREQARKGG